MKYKISHTQASRTVWDTLKRLADAAQELRDRCALLERQLEVRRGCPGASQMSLEAYV